jgi:hypothetical protein
MLPKITKTMIARVRRELKGQGYSLVNTEHFFKPNFCWDTQAGCVPGNYTDFKYAWTRTYADWQKDLLNAALPEEKIFSPTYPLSLRVTENGYFIAGNGCPITCYPVPKVDNSERPHTDGAWIRAMATVEGAPTILCLNTGPTAIPFRHTLFVTGHDREISLNIPSTVHLKPKTTNEHRKFIVIGWTSELKKSY